MVQEPVCRISAFSLVGIKLHIPSEQAKGQELIKRKAWEPSGKRAEDQEIGRTYERTEC